ncbi:transposase [Streptomyces sp. NBC_00882]|uniref:transposase n=1 Tax=Streptomyces sp. NBC_00882 TaxID=2975856 RepID=UPI0038687711
MRAPVGEPVDHAAIGLSRDGLTTKIHVAADARRRPLAFVLTAGQAGDAPVFTDVMARLRILRRRARPRTRPDVVLADKAYSSPAIRARAPAQARHPCGDPGPGGPARSPAAPWQPGRQATGLRPRDLQAVRRHRAVHQPSQAAAGYRDPLREDRDYGPTWPDSTTPASSSGPPGDPNESP